MPQNPMHTAVDPRIQHIYGAVRGRIDLDRIVPSCIAIAQEVEQLTHLKGPQKLELLQNVLRLAVVESKLSGEKQEEIFAIIDTVIPIVMQAAILASKIPIKSIHATCSKKCC